MDQFNITVTALAGSALVLAAARFLPQRQPALQPVPVRADLRAGWYASTTAPTAGSSGPAPTPGTPAAAAPIDTVARRKLLRWFGWTTLLVILGELAAGFLPFFWPRRTGSFGGVIVAGNVNDFKVGEVKKITEGKFFISRVPPRASWRVAEVPAPRLRRAVERGRAHAGHHRANRPFQLSCHGSQYDRYGQIKAGPVPRPMDMFPITISNGRISVDTAPAKVIHRSVDEGNNHTVGPVPA